MKVTNDTSHLTAFNTWVDSAAKAEKFTPTQVDKLKHKWEKIYNKSIGGDFKESYQALKSKRKAYHLTKENMHHIKDALKTIMTVSKKAGTVFVKAPTNIEPDAFDDVIPPYEKPVFMQPVFMQPPFMAPVETAKVEVVQPEVVLAEVVLAEVVLEDSVQPEVVLAEPVQPQEVVLTEPVQPEVVNVQIEAQAEAKVEPISEPTKPEAPEAKVIPPQTNETATSNIGWVKQQLLKVVGSKQ